MTDETFRIAIDEDQVQELKSRLARARFPADVASYGWNEGTPARYLRNLIEYWHHDYDWRAREKRLNEFDQSIITVQGHAIHIIRAMSTQGGIPLLMMGGWPSSFIQMLEILPLLTKPQQGPAFDVVVAALPGYPFATLENPEGMNFGRIADLMVELMTDHLGYERFGVRGSDQGGLVLQQMGLRHPHRLIGLHRSGITPFIAELPKNLDSDETAYLAKVQDWAKLETPYAQMQSQRPETVVPAFSDSPLALASWFIEKFQRWGNCGGRDPDVRFGRDRLLDNLSLHWFTRSAVSSTRLYLEASRAPAITGRVQVPTAIMMPLRDAVTIPAPRSWCERFYQVERFVLAPTCGHFAEWEEPEATAADLGQFFAAIS